MKLRMVTSAVSSALLATGFAACSIAQAQDTTTQGNTMTVIVGGAPDLTYSTSNIVTTPGAAPGAMGNPPVGTTGATVVRGISPVTVEGVAADWVPQVDEPVVPGIVVKQDIMADRATVFTGSGYVVVPTAAGARVLDGDKLVNWLTVPVGQVVSIPVGALTDGPVPHKVQVPAPTLTDYAAMNTRIMNDLKAAFAADAAAQPPAPEITPTPAPTPAPAPATPPTR